MWASLNVNAQSVQQNLGFSIMASLQREGTNVVSPGHTNYNYQLYPIFINKNNIVKAIALDVAGTNWGHWGGAAILRRINLATGEEAMFLSQGGTDETNVSQYFTNSLSATMTDSLTSGLPPELTNGLGTNFMNPLYAGTVNNVDGIDTASHYTGASGLCFFTLKTTNMVLNLVGVSLNGFGNGAVSEVATVGTNFPGPVPITHEMFSVVGSVYVNIMTNTFVSSGALDTTNAVFVAGPAVGTVGFQPPFRSGLQAP